jgi:isopentenyl-diphosphate delta-isomerase
MNSEIILVDKDDTQIGIEEKLEAHKKGLLHRAFSILVFNSKGETLIQRRANGKYHSRDLWSNTCCSHPRPDHILKDEAKLRLKEEMGFSCELERLFVFSYKTIFDNSLIENEIDHVFIGKHDGDVKPNPEEVSDYKWVSIKDIRKDMEKSPEKYTEWFKIIILNYSEKLRNK